MTIEFQCPSCSKTLRVKDELAGKRGKCPKCQDPIEIPQASDQSVPKTPRPQEEPTAVASEPSATPAPTQPPPLAGFAPPKPEKRAAPVVNPFAATQTPEPSASGTSFVPQGGMLVLKRVDLASCALMSGAYCAFLGFLVSIPMALITMLGGAMAMSSRNPLPASGILGGLLGIVLIPVLYGVFGLIGGFISGVFYNIAAHFAGGLKFKTG